MHFLETVTLEQALKEMKEQYKPWAVDTEEVSLSESFQRVLGCELFSPMDLPEFHRSTVDGYAIHAQDAHGASENMPAILTIVGQVQMGQAFEGAVADGEAVAVPTGGMIPVGADCCVMIENTEEIGMGLLSVYKGMHEGENRILRGSDLQKGQLLFPKGTLIDASVMAVLAGIGQTKVSVIQRIKVFIISTGDEIIDTHEVLTLGKIYDINAYAIGAIAAQHQMTVVGQRIIADQFEAIQQAVAAGLQIADMIVLSGGSSAGEKDYTEKVIGSFEDGHVFVHGLAIKPGKPTILGKIGHKPVIGLPGHPVAAYIVFYELVLQFLKQKGVVSGKDQMIFGKLIENIHSAPGRKTFQMVTFEDGDGEFLVTPLYGKSGNIRLLSNAKGYIEMGESVEGLYQGQVVKVKLLG